MRTNAAAATTDKPPAEQLEFLDDLRESGITNLFGAAPFLRDEFPDLSIQEARQVLSYWMKNFPA